LKIKIKSLFGPTIEIENRFKFFLGNEKTFQGKKKLKSF